MENKFQSDLSTQSNTKYIVSSPHHKTKSTRRGLLVQKAVQAETKLEVKVKAAQIVEEASRPLVANLTTALAGPWLILQIRI